MTFALLGTVIATSVIGSLHCAAMCGPFVALATAGGGGLPALLAYNLGRLGAYLALGAVAGAVGAALDRAGDLLEMQRIAAVIAGAAILAWGVVALLSALGVRWPDRNRRPRAPTVAAGALVRARRRRPAVRAALIGLVTAALPCGWLYAFVIAAASTGSPWSGIALMAAFWLGTVPMMLGLGLVLRRLARGLGRRMPFVTAGALIALGVAALIARAPLLGDLPAPSSTGALPTTPPCHGG